MKNARHGIWIIDANGSTVYANAAMAAILGEERAGLIGKPTFAYVFPEDLEAAKLLFQSKPRSDASRFRFRLRRKDGSAIRVEVQATPMHNKSGEFLGIVGTFSVLEQQVEKEHAA